MSDLVGYLACFLVLATFSMKDMIPLRVTAMCSNLAFLTYGIALGLVPVTLLHATLLPMNAWRLLNALRERQLLATTQARTHLQAMELDRARDRRSPPARQQMTGAVKHRAGFLLGVGRRKLTFAR